MRFVDAMDESRIIEPTNRTVGKSTVCRVFFRDNRGVPRYVGTAPVPTGLIGDDSPINRYVGFTPTTG